MDNTYFHPKKKNQHMLEAKSFLIPFVKKNVHKSFPIYSHFTFTDFFETLVGSGDVFNRIIFVNNFLFECVILLCLHFYCHFSTFMKMFHDTNCHQLTKYKCCNKTKYKCCNKSKCPLLVMDRLWVFKKQRTWFLLRLWYF